MPDRISRPPAPRRALLVATALAIAVGSLLGSVAHAVGDHLLITEVATGGASASDEFIELYNPTPAPVSLAGHEVVYVSASGATVTQRASWAADAPVIEPRAYVVLANEAGAYAAAADATYAGGIAATGGTVVLRIAGSGAVDAVAWGVAAGDWLEGTPAPAPAAGASIERVTDPGNGRVADTDDNAADFVERIPPTPRAGGMALASTAPSPTAGATATPAPTSSATPTPAPSASSSAVSVAKARAAPNGAVVTVDGTALTASTFHDGGGYVADGTGGIAILVEGGSFVADARVVVTGTVEDRFAQRTIRASAAGVVVLPAASVIAPAHVATGAIGEALEGTLVTISGVVRGVPTTLASGLAFDVDDGGGAVRVFVATATGIDTGAWVPGATVDIAGVVGQRDSSGTGTSGYRLMPRSAGDVLRVSAPVEPTATATATPSTPPDATPVASAGEPVITPIASARRATPGTAVTVRGVVTMPAGVVDATTAAIQDETAGIIVRVEEGGTPLRTGDLVEVTGVRSTRSGMETIRATRASTVLNTGANALPTRVAADGAWEELEARLVVVTGTLPASARRASSGTVSFDLADERGAVRVVIPAPLGADDAQLVAGVVVEVVGVVGQETTGDEPSAGYRVWPRAAAEVRVVRAAAHDVDGERGAPPTTARSGGGEADDASVSTGGHVAATETLDAVGTDGLAGIRVGATLVTGDWPELGVAGLLWDGERLVAISVESRAAVALLAARPPLPIAARGLRLVGIESSSGVPLVALGSGPGDLEAAAGHPDAPSSILPERGEDARWVSVVGTTVSDGAARSLRVGGATVRLRIACDDFKPPKGMVSVTGIGLATGVLIVPCDGMRAAPALLLSATAEPHRTVPPHREKATTLAAAAVVEQRRPLAAVLLVLGAALATGGAAYARRRALADDGLDGEDVADARGDEPEGPRLTLLPLRRDGS